MRRFLLGVVGVLALLVLGFFALAPGIIERGLNQLDGQELIPVSEEARTLHATLTIVDLHSDTLLWKRNILQRSGRGHMDLPRLQDGNVALQVLSSVSKSPAGMNFDRNSAEARDDITLLAVAQLQPLGTWDSLLERTLWHARKLDLAVAASAGDLVKVTSPATLAALLERRANRADWSAHPESAITEVPQAPVGTMLSVEGLHNLEGDLANVDVLYDAGFRMVGLTHFFDNEVAGSMHGEDKGGLTEFGREVVARMEGLGMVVDLAHCSNACVADVLAMARRPVVSSHGGVRATCNVNRNLSDEQIRGIAATGGLVGIGYWPGAVCDTSPHAIANAMRHVRDLVGIEHVALGSDYDGTILVRFDTSQLVQVTQALLDAGFTEEEIRLAMGGNALRVLQAGVVPLEEDA